MSNSLILSEPWELIAKVHLTEANNTNAFGNKYGLADGTDPQLAADCKLPIRIEAPPSHEVTSCGTGAIRWRRHDYFGPRQAHVAFRRIRRRAGPRRSLDARRLGYRHRPLEIGLELRSCENSGSQVTSRWRKPDFEPSVPRRPWSSVQLAARDPIDATWDADPSRRQAISAYVARLHIWTKPASSSDWWFSTLALAEVRRLTLEFLASVRSSERRARDVMTAPVVTVGEEAEIDEVARLLTAHRIKRVPVLRDGRIVGIVSRADLVGALAEPKMRYPRVNQHRVGTPC